MTAQQTAYVGDDIKVLVNVVDSTGSHVAAVIDTSTTRLNGYSTVPTVNTINTGIYEIVFSSVTPAPAEGARLICKVNGAISGVAWSEYAIPVLIVADERGTNNASTFDYTTNQVTVATNNDKTGYSLATAPPTAAEIYSEFTSGTNEDAFKADLTGIAAAVAALNDLSQADIRTAIGLATANLDSQLGDIPTVAEFNARSLASADYATSSSISALNNLSQADIRSAVGLASANLDTQLSNLNTQIGVIDGVVDNIIIDTGTDIPALINGLNDLDAAGIRSAVGLASANLDTQLGDIPTVSEFNARSLASADYATSASISALNDLDASEIRAAIGLASANLDTQLSNLNTQIGTIDGVVDSILIDTGTDIPALINGLNDLDAAGIRSAVGLASANLDTQLADIPTVSEFNARTLISSAYFDPSTDAVTVGTNNDKTGYSLVVTPPTALQVADAVWDEILTGATHNIPTSAGRRLRQVADVGVYEGAQVWIDTVNGSAGTADYENGTVDNPSNNIADATTIANSVGITRFRIAPDSSLTFATGYSGYNFWGDGQWTLALGGQALDRTHILNAIVSGTCTSSDRPAFERCDIGTTTLPPCYILESRLTSTITLSGAGDYILDHCSSAVAGTGSPSIDFGSAGNTNLNIRHYSGGVEILNMGQNGTDNMSLEGNGQLRINANCTGGTIALRGNFKITDNSGGAVTLVKDDKYNDLSDVKAKTDQFVFTVPNQVDANSLTGGLSEAQVRDAVGLASANLDTQLADLPTSAEIATEILAAGDVDGYSLEETLKLCLAALAGKISGAGSGTITIRSADDSADRIVATTDNLGNRLSITIDEAG